MPLPLVDFWKRLLKSGLADATTPRLWAADFANDHDSTPPSDPLTLAKWLVQTDRLKPFQAACLTRPNPHADSEGEQNHEFRFPVLRIAPLTQVAEQSRPTFASWLPVTHDSYPGESGIVLQISPAGLKPHDGDRLRWIAELRHAGLPQYELMVLPGAPLGNYFTTIPLETSLDAIGLFARVPPGESLAEKCVREPTSRWTADQVVPLLQTLIGAMQLLAGGQLTSPPMPSPDRIWIPHDARSPAILWIDPAEYLSPNALACSRTIASNDSPLLYTAPEMIAGSMPQPSSWESQAVYALGCLAYRLRFGQHAFAAAKDEQIRSRQLRFEPPELSEAVAQGAAGDPLLRVLAYALAKNPQSRFASLEAFAQALAATLPLADQVSTPEVPRGEVSPRTKPPEKSPPRKSTPRPEQQPAATSPKAPAPAPAPAKVAAKVAATAEDKAEVKAEDSAADRQPAKPRSGTARGRDGNLTAIASTAAARAEPCQKVEQPARESAAAEDHPTQAPPPTQAPVAGAAQCAAEQPRVAAVATASVKASAAEASPLAAASSRNEATAEVEVSSTAAAETEATSGSVPAASLPDTPQRAPRRPSRRRTAWLVLGGMWIPILLLIVALALQDPDAPQPVAQRIRPPMPAVIPSVTGRRPAPPRPRPRPSTDAGSGNADRIEIVSDDRMLWAPPSALAAADVADERVRATMLLPPGPAALTTFNLPNLDATGLSEIFDPELSPLWDQLQKRIAVPIEDVRLLALAWFPGRDGVPEFAMAVHLKSPRTLDELTDSWEASLAVVPGGARIYAGDDADSDAYYPHFVASDQSEDESAQNSAGTRQVDAFAVGSIARVTQVAEVEGAPVLLPRQLEELWQTTRPTDAVAMLSVPYFLIADSRAWINRAAPPLLDWIRSTLTPECGGLLVRVVAAPDASTGSDTAAHRQGSYVELRLAMAPGQNPAALKSKVLARIDEASITAEDFLVSREIDPSWRLLAARLPSMWIFTGEQIRSAAIRREVIFNAYLPPLALPQLALGTLLAANTTATTAAASTPPSMEKLTIEEMLDRPMSVSFGQESLQFAIDTIINEFAADLPEGTPAPAVEIIGGDLQKMGITQNQQVRDFSKTDLPLRTVLTDLMLGANPDRTATGPDDPKQALIWVVVGEGDSAEIKVTTREAAQGTYELPKEFQIQE